MLSTGALQLCLSQELRPCGSVEAFFSSMGQQLSHSLRHAPLEWFILLHPRLALDGGAFRDGVWSVALVVRVV